MQTTGITENGEVDIDGIGADGEVSELENVNSENLGDVITGILNRVYPIEPIGGNIDPKSYYSPTIHAQICRLAFLGVSNATIAKAVRISPSTLATWISKYPKLAYDIHQAKALSITSAVVRLRQIMNEDSATALPAIKFFLQSRSADFTDKKQLEVIATDTRTLIGGIRQEMYGIQDAEARRLPHQSSEGKVENDPDSEPGDSSCAPPLWL